MYIITGDVDIAWVGDGVSAQSVPSAQRLKVTVGRGQASQIVVPGGDSPTTGNISSACTTLGTTLATLLNAQIGTIQGWSTGGN